MNKKYILLIKCLCVIIAICFVNSNVYAYDYTAVNGTGCTANCSNFDPYFKQLTGDPNNVISVHVSSGGVVNMTEGEYIHQPGIFTEEEISNYDNYGAEGVWLHADPDGNFYDRDNVTDRRTMRIENAPEGTNELLEATVEGFRQRGRMIFRHNSGIGGGNKKPPKEELPPGWIGCDVGKGPKSVPATPIPSHIDVSGTYAVMLELTPVKPIGFEKLTPEQQAAWEATHHKQTIGPYLTPYGEFLSKHMGEIEGLKGQPDSAWRSMQGQLEAAKAQPYNLETLVLDDVNLQGIQTGGAYTITEFTKEASVHVDEETEQFDVYECQTETYIGQSWEKNEETGKWEWVDKEMTRTRYGYRGRETGKTYVTKSFVDIQTGGWTPKNSYQIITVRCNASELAKIVASTGSSIYSGSTTASSSAQSPTVGGGVASFFNDLTVEFFYEGKDCENNIPCVVGETITDKPTNENGGGNGNGKETYFGTESKGIRSDHFTFFRDNVSNLVINDVWTPNISKIYRDVVVKEATPNGTYLTLSKDGTPKGDLFNIEDVNNNVILSGDKFPTINYYVARQKENQFNWKASWATDQEHPHKANIKYGYRLHVITTVPTLNASGIVGTSTYSDKFIDLFCHTTFNSNVPTKPIVYNKPDEYNYKPFTEFDDTKGRYVTIDFVKTSAE